MRNGGDVPARLLAKLACPHCRQPLSASDPGISCSTHGEFARFGPIVSFVPDAASPFDSHWQLANDVQRPRAKVDAARRFLAPVIASAHEIHSVLDIGCGDGVHVQELLRSGLQFDVAGLDLSLQGLVNAAQLPGEWLPIHADAQSLPFADESFDAVISFGVHAYLDEPEVGITEAVRVVRPGGLVGLWIAPPPAGAAGKLFSMARQVVPRLPRWFQITLANALVPFLGLMPTSSRLSLRTGSWRECREVVLVNIAPRSIAFPTRTQVERLLREHSCEMIGRADSIIGEYWARKRSAHEGSDPGK